MATGVSLDPDGDSQMASSPESSHLPSDIEDWQGSRTPTRPSNTSNNHVSQFAGVSELSPPGSQTQITTVDMGGVAELGEITPGGPSTTAVGVSAHGGEDLGQEQPGASWMSKRAQEEYQRALENVVDQDFNLDEFGDPFDESDMKEKLI